MELQKFIDSVRGSLAESANVRRVFGDPIAVGDKMVIPVARIAYGFGAGGGSGRRKGTEQTESECGVSQEGGGGGGGMGAVPLGVLEVTAERTRFIGLGGRKKFIAGVVIGLAAGRLFLRRR